MPNVKIDGLRAFAQSISQINRDLSPIVPTVGLKPDLQVIDFVMQKCLMDNLG